MTVIFVFLLVLFAQSADGLLTSKVAKVDRVSLKNELLDLVKNSDLGQKSTTTDRKNIEELVFKLNKVTPFKAPASSFGLKGKNELKGDWDLIYTDAPDVLTIAKVPGVQLDYIKQIIDDNNSIINLIFSSGSVVDTEQEVVVLAKQKSDTGVSLDFKKSKTTFMKLFQKDKIFGKSIEDVIKPIEIKFKVNEIERERAAEVQAITFNKPKRNNNRQTPGFDFLYVDKDFRIHRTNEGFLFVFKRSLDIQNIEDNGFNGIGPWLKNKIGENGMKTLGLVSLVPYILFFLKFIQNVSQ